MVNLHILVRLFSLGIFSILHLEAQSIILFYLYHGYHVASSING